MGIRGLRHIAARIFGSSNEDIRTENHHGVSLVEYNYALPRAPYNLAVDASMWVVPCLRARTRREFILQLRRKLECQLRRFDTLFRCACYTFVALDRYAPPMKRETQQSRMTKINRSFAQRTKINALHTAVNSVPLLRMDGVRRYIKPIFQSALERIGIADDRVFYCYEEHGEGECKCARFTFPGDKLLRVILTNDSDAITMQMRLKRDETPLHAYLINNPDQIIVLAGDWYRGLTDDQLPRWKLILITLILFGNDYVDAAYVQDFECRRTIFVRFYSLIVDDDDIDNKDDLAELSRTTFLRFLDWVSCHLRAEFSSCLVDADAHDAHDSQDNTHTDMINWLKRLYWALLYALEAPVCYETNSTFKRDVYVSIRAHVPRGKINATQFSTTEFETTYGEMMENMQMLCSEMAL